MKKKVLAMIMATAMVVSLAACGSAATEEAAPADDAAATTEEAAGSADAAAPAGTVTVADGEEEADLNYTNYDLSGVTIGYVTINSSAPWGGLVGTSFAQYAEEVGAKVNSLDAQTNADQVTEYCQQMIDAGVDVLVVFGGDPAANAEIAKTASEAGIKMFMAGLDVGDGGQEYVSAVVGPDQEQMTADIAARVVEDNGTTDNHVVVQINGVPFLDDYIQRCAGFQGYMADYPNYDLSAEPADCYSDRTQAKTSMEEFMTAYPDVDIVMGYDDDLTMGAVQAIEEAGKTGEIKVYSLTGQNDAIQAVADGKLELTVMNRASDIGMGLVSTIAKVLNGESVAYFQRTPLTMIDSSNVNDYIGKGEF